MTLQDWNDMWVPQWPLPEVALRAAIIYLAVQVLLRLLGRKELGRYSTYDVALLFIVTTAARQSIVGDDTSLTSAFVALATIFGLEYLLSWLAARSSRFGRWIAGGPRWLVREGEVLERQLRAARLSREQLLSHLRLHGREDLADVKDARLEPSGHVSFIFWPPART